MDIDIRSHIKKNFKNASEDEIKSSIISSLEDNEDITLPGLGVFFEILWLNSDEDYKNYLLKTIKKGL